MKNKYSDKTIHMLWNTAQYPKFVETCYNSYKRVNPDWDVVLHIGLEEVFDKNFEYYYLYKQLYDLQMTINPTISKLVDIIRIYLLHHYGGIYVDTDTYAIRPFNEMYGINFKSKDVPQKYTAFDLNTWGLWTNRDEICIKEIKRNIDNFPLVKNMPYKGIEYGWIMNDISNFIVHLPELPMHITNFKQNGIVKERKYPDILYQKLNISKNMHFNRHFYCETTYHNFKQL